VRGEKVLEIKHCCLFHDPAKCAFLNHSLYSPYEFGASTQHKEKSPNARRVLHTPSLSETVLPAAIEVEVENTTMVATAEGSASPVVDVNNISESSVTVHKKHFRQARTSTLFHANNSVIASFEICEGATKLPHVLKETFKNDTKLSICLRSAQR
jgi:carbamate kinase